MHGIDDGCQQRDCKFRKLAGVGIGLNAHSDVALHMSGGRVF